MESKSFYIPKQRKTKQKEKDQIENKQSGDMI